MKTQCFDALITIEQKGPAPSPLLLVLNGHKLHAQVRVFSRDPSDSEQNRFVQVSPSQPVEVFWESTLELREPGSRRIWGKGRVLDPSPPRVSRRIGDRRRAQLQALSGPPKEMLFALIEGKGVKGMSGEELKPYANLTDKFRLNRLQELESEGRIKILSFDPLFLLAESSFTFICEKLLRHIQTQHQKNPNLLGLSPKSLHARFRLPERVQRLALGTLERAGYIRWWEGRILPFDHQVRLSEAEEKILADLEELSLKGELKSISLDEIRRRFRLSSDKLNLLLNVLTQREKIIQGEDGFLIHAQWLEELISRLRSLGKDEVSIAEFKSLTGLSRKYAIPLLEFLDQLGVTRRKGSVRRILLE